MSVASINLNNMFKLVIVSFVLGLTYGAPQIHPTLINRIVGGSSIDITQVPYQVAIGNATSIWCGGTIISEHFVVTAAHCFNDHDITTEGFLVFVGMTSLNNVRPEMAKGVQQINVHPSYDRQNQNIDIAIVELNGDLDFNAQIQKVDLPKYQEVVPIGAYGYASGWGKLSENGPSPTNLQGVGIQFLDASDCSGYSNFNNRFMQCGGSLTGTVDTCQGDSGGPLVYNNLLYGITSFGKGCASPGFPGVYANVANLRDYITEITGF